MSLGKVPDPLCDCKEVDTQGRIYNHLVKSLGEKFCKHKHTNELISTAKPRSHENVTLKDETYQYKLTIDSVFWNDKFEKDETKLYFYQIAVRAANSYDRDTLMTSFLKKNVCSVKHSLPNLGQKQ